MATNDGNGFFDDWPAWSRPTLALAAMILLGGAWIGIPLLSAWHLVDRSVGSSSVVNYQPMIVVLVAMTTATITGIFVFMTFRIDRGARLKAEITAKDEVKKPAKGLRKLRKKTKKKIQNLLDETEHKTYNFLIEKFNEGTAPEEIRRQIEARLSDDVLRERLGVVLMIDANLQVVREYARERVRDLDPKTIERIAHLLKEIFESWSRLVESPREGGHADFWVKAKAFFGKFRRSPRDGQRSRDDTAD